MSARCGGYFQPNSLSCDKHCVLSELEARLDGTPVSPQTERAALRVIAIALDPMSHIPRVAKQCMQFGVPSGS